MIAITDSVADGMWDFMVHPGQDYKDSQWPGRVHSAGANALFCDGHVSWYTQKELTNVDGTSPAALKMRRMWNSDHGLNGRSLD